MFSKSLQWRLVIIIVTITFVLMSVIWVFLNYKVEDIFYYEFKTTILNNYSILGINESMSETELEWRLMDDPNILSQLTGFDKSYTIINGSTLEIIYSSDVLYEENKVNFRNEIFKSQNLINVINGAMTGEEKYLTKSSDGDFYDYVKRQPLADGDYILFFKYNRTRALSIIKEFNHIILTGTIIAVVFTIVIGFLLAKTITKPIVDIMHKAENITSGDFGQVLEVKSDDEIGKLTKTFNYMSSQLKRMLAEISSEKNKFERILNFMTDGILAFNTEGQIIHINTAARSLFDLNEGDQTFAGIMEKLGLRYTLQDLLSRKNLAGISDNVEIKNRFFKIYFATFSDNDNVISGIIAVLQDYTEEKKLDNMRKEFVANVSHELKTPLTSIKSYTETLLDGAFEDAVITRNFLKVIYAESDRMDRLVKDLLLLSKHDSGIRLNLKRLSLPVLTKSVIERMRISAEEKKQSFNIIIEDEDACILGDRDRLEQLLFNIIGNAIKYTPEEGSITIIVGTDDKNAYARVIDTGIGIPEKDIDRIFERFYRVDKARSRQMGGTGLGLSIAQEIAKTHGGSIHAKSELNKGTEILVLLPRNRDDQEDDYSDLQYEDEYFPDNFL
ncbi:MAG: cell wall metabolism sensor histidine kinase WalK [Clostridiaceae bacterium]|jgi:two-component system sensor histidine kinase VicK|nr:cell wall metabolism sensor histidine kinase WalK [Clostridiaceae bacterium]